MPQLLMPFLDKTKTQVVRKSNELIEARYKLSIAEQRLVLLLASEISPNDEDFKSYEIRVADFAKMFGLEKCKSMYEKVEQAAEDLLSQKIVLQDNETKEITNWLSYVKYIKGSGVVNLEFHKSLKPYLLQLKSHYTQYQLNYVMNFNSQYSMRLYELLKMDAFKANKNGLFERCFELKEYRELLGVDKKAYSVFSDFRKCIIEPLVSEISDKTDLYINDVRYGKTGRKITNITFSVQIRTDKETKLRQANLRIEDIKPEKEKDKDNDNHPIIETLMSHGFSFEIAKKCQAKHGVKKIERNLAYTLAKKQEGKVSDVPAYLNKAIENDYGSAWDIENQKKVEAELKAKKEKAEKDRLEQVQKSKEEQLSQARKIMYQDAFDNFLKLPVEQQEAIKNEFIQATDSFTVKRMKESEKNNEPWFTSPIVSQNFKIFLSKRECK